jgi:hypothetical protein
MEDRYPGMWQRWYRHQCVAVGWYSKWGYRLAGKSNGEYEAGAAMTACDPKGTFALLNEGSAFRFSGPTLGASFTPRRG